MKRIIPLGWALVLVLAACAGTRADIDAEFLPGTATSTTTSITSSTTSTTIPDGIEEQVGALVGSVRDLRGLPLAVPPIEYRPTDDLQARYRAQRGLARTGDLRFDEAFLGMLGVLGAGEELADLEDFCGVPGFYDPSTGTLLLDEQLAGGELTPFGVKQVVSELVGAATDQAHGWYDEMESLRRGGDDEAAVALWGLVAGDATFHTDQYVERQLDQTDRFAIRLEEIACQQGRTPPPAYVTTLEDFGPGAGRAFVEDLISDGGRAAVEAAYRSPPTSTEQIYHPARYADGETPRTVELAPIAATGFDEEESGTFGERMFRAVLSEGVSSAQALQGATGWGGDSYEVLWDGSDVVLVLMFEGDQDRDARELAETLGGWASASMRVGSGRPDNTGLAFEGEQYAFVAHRGDALLLVLSSDAAAGRSVRDTFWPQW
jgi:hypothetical protein